VSTLAVLALPSNAPRVLAAIDARMGEVYAAAFACRDGGVVPLDAERVVAPSTLVLPDEDGAWAGVGTGFAAADGALQTRLASRFHAIDAQALPHAADVARLAAIAFAKGEAVAPERIEPAYLRDNVALTLAEQRAAKTKI
jgi:tRNA threonylcarbamoyladenosine biosynthesis protein TsaB